MAQVLPHGKTDPIIIDEIFAGHLGRPAQPDEVAAIFAAYTPYLEAEVACSPGFVVLPGAMDAVEYLAAQPDVALGVASGNIRACAKIKLERAGLWHRFAFGAYGDDAADRAELVAHAVSRARAHVGRDVADADIVVVGDTPRDVDAARACGVRVVVVPTGRFRAPELEATGADAVLASLHDLPAWHRSQRRR
jgi:phosphoglycolate phosphatase-like HAD superfamily hydrolase